LWLYIKIEKTIGINEFSDFKHVFDHVLLGKNSDKVNVSQRNV
jgi:hypothetical protein